MALIHNWTDTWHYSYAYGTGEGGGGDTVG